MAMNRYLGKKEKSGFVQFVRLLSSVEEKIDELATVPSTDKQYLKHLRTAKTWLRKAVDLRVSALDDDAKDDLWRQVNRIEPIVFIPSAQAKHELKTLQEAESVVHIPVDDFQDLYCEMIEKTCKVCVEEEYKECAIYRVCIANNIFPPSPEAAPDRCPYTYVDNEEALAELDKNTEHRRIRQNIAALDMAKEKVIEKMKECESLRGEVTQKDIEVCKLQGTIEKLERKVQEAGAMNASLQKGIDDDKKRFQEARKQLEENARTIDDLKKERAWLRADVEDMTRQLADYQAKEHQPTSKLTIYFRGGQTITDTFTKDQIMELYAAYEARKRIEVQMDSKLLVIDMSAVIVMEVE